MTMVGKIHTYMTLVKKGFANPAFRRLEALYQKGSVSHNIVCVYAGKQIEHEMTSLTA